jgi:hypothetical protein
MRQVFVDVVTEDTRLPLRTFIATVSKVPVIIFRQMQIVSKQTLLSSAVTIRCGLLRPSMIVSITESFCQVPLAERQPIPICNVLKNKQPDVQNSGILHGPRQNPIDMILATARSIR